MKHIDFKSVAVAGLFGAAIVGVIAMMLNANNSDSNTVTWAVLPLGFAIGAGTQVGVRLVGVS